MVPEYVHVTVSATPLARVAIEQFDASRSRGVLGFGDGWYEPELNPATGQRWRWLGGRGELRYLTYDESGATLHLEGESPRRYYPRESRIIVSAQVAAGAGASASVVSVVLRDVTVGDDFSFDVRVPGSTQPSTIVVETDQTHVPSETSWRSTLDRRRLGLRIFKCELRP